MTRTPPAAKPVFQTPTRMEWTDEKLAALSEEQLVNLLDNLDVQRANGRVTDAQAADLEGRISARLPTRVNTKRRKKLAAAAEIAQRLAAASH